MEILVSEKKEDLNIKVYQTEEGGYIRTNKIVVNNIRTFYTCGAPHGNCQTASIIYFNEILTLPDKDVRTIIEYIWEEALEGKRQILVDVEEYYQSKIQSIFKDCDIVFENPYISSNDSEMIMYLIKIDEITGYVEDDDY